MTFGEAYASLKSLYKDMMFPENQKPKWTMTEIDQLDVHFFYELLKKETPAPQSTVKKFINDIF